MVITLNEREIDLQEAINFSFNLNEQQLGALETIVEFLDSNVQCCTMQGSAGVGKTTIVKIIMHYLHACIGKLFLLCAPTHKARVVLKTLCEHEAETLHSVLNLKPNFDVTEFDARQLDFMIDREIKLGTKRPTIPFNGLLIIDEASMINNDLYDLIMKKAKEKNCKVLFIGDMAQLQPVKQGEISRVFQTNGMYKIVLTKVERQKDGNPLLDTLTILREHPIHKYSTSLDSKSESGLVVFPDQLDFLRNIKSNMTPDAIRADPYRNRVLSYTNKRVAGYNKAIRKILQYNDEFNIGELLMAYDNYSVNSVSLLVNSCDYIIDKITECKVEVPEFGEVDGYSLVITDLNAEDYYTKTKVIRVIGSGLAEYVYAGIAYTMENLRQKAIQAKAAGKSYAGMFWRKFYMMNEAICCSRDLVYENRVIKKKTIGYGYAHTIHKSQGATYQNIFVDMTDVMKCGDQNELRQLQYVALSRARKKAFLLI